MEKLKHPNSQTRLSMYHTASYILHDTNHKFYQVGICEILYSIYKWHYDLPTDTELNVNKITELFPELKVYNPNPSTPDYWWPGTEQGRLKRIEVISEIIQKLST